MFAKKRQKAHPEASSGHCGISLETVVEDPRTEFPETLQYNQFILSDGRPEEIKANQRLNVQMQRARLACVSATQAARKGFISLQMENIIFTITARLQLRT